MQRNKLIAAFAFAVAAAAALGAAETYDLPRSGEVVIVSRVVMTPAINDAFFSKYYGLEAGSLIIEKNENKDGKPVTSTSEMVLDTKSIAPTTTYGMGDIGSFSTLKVNIPSDRKIGVKVIRVFPAGLYMFKVILPIFAEITIPEGQNYVYIGTLSFNWEGVQFTVTGAKKIDEFDKAAQTVKERYGKDATLVRVPLKDEKPRS